MEDSIMTIVVGVIAKPKGKRKPFCIIGSDSRGLDLIENELVGTDTKEKIFPFGKMFIGIAGAVPSDIFEDLPNTIREYNLNFEEACLWLKDEVTKYLNRYDPKEVNPLSQYIRMTMLLISMEGNTPKLAKFEYDTSYKTNTMSVNKVILNENVMAWSDFIGNTRRTKELQSAFKNELEGFNGKLSIINIKQMMKEFMFNTADAYPEKCNKLLNFYVIEGE
jgi:hypothetical protein